MAVTENVAELCRLQVEGILIECRLHGRDPTTVLKAFRTVVANDTAPLKDMLITEIDRTLLTLEAAVPA